MLLEHVRSAARRDSAWSAFFDEVMADEAPVALHLAIFVEPYLQFVLDSSKTVESRFSRNGCAPFGRVHRGDVLLLKRASGPLVGACTVGDVWDYRLTPRAWAEIEGRFGSAICPQEGFWELKRQAAYATLMRISEPRALPAIDVPKRDRRGWVVLTDLREPRLL